MELTYNNERFEFNCTFAEKDIAKSNGFKWDMELKKWFTKDISIAEKLKEYANELCLHKFEKSNERIEMSRAIDTNIKLKKPQGLKFDYFNFQKAGIVFGINNKNVLIADDMGLGKTVQAIGILNQLESFGTVLIVCPKTPMLNWRNELKTWLIEDREIIICNSKIDVKNDNKIYIINYDILAKVNIDKVDVLIADEVHYAKNKTAQRSKTFYKIKTNRKIYLSGTPIMNRPSEIYHIIKSLDKDVFGTQFEFWKRYCDLKETKWGKDYSGASNLEELNYKLRSSVMIRRMKDEVLKDMPDKIRQVIKFEGNKKLIEQEMMLYSSAKNENFKPSSMADIIKLRQEIAIKKIPQILDYVNDTLENESKLIIFAHHKEVIETLERELSKEHEVVKIDGSVSQEDRQNAVDRFQKGTANIFIGSIRACSEAITLTASNHVIFAEIDWTPGKNIQAEDRAYRIGQKNTVNITYLVYENSVDEYILNTNITKEEVINKALE